LDQPNEADENRKQQEGGKLEKFQHRQCLEERGGESAGYAPGYINQRGVAKERSGKLGWFVGV
jgi:hypothetical protein